ncbi:hypothetical protein AMAG_17996 [Allomyces macrogynus ATCC 38327]|uniref:Uncharacterized protein n=1 Tax=Allomyces macrogynus (strain ATCC 38327) TaxID=578462 RepID=A0A0L0S3Q9_ALLM3|nr:hypothetical protein AMAG_17996 [Allomyces macrogynus ATCC 38327]|eukprot:KNE57041.1 hypothetical protein AMAG_17996 [Allomyces macrogynus ATCC 38327]
MTSPVTNFANVLPTSLGKEMIYTPPKQAPVADHTTIKFPCTQGSAFSASGNGLGSTIRFQIPAVNKIVDLSAGVHFSFKASTYKDAACTQPTTTGAPETDQLLEDIDGYGLLTRMLSDATVPAALKSTDCWLNLKHTSGLIIEITLAEPKACMINTTGTVGGYVVSEPYLMVDTVTLHAAQLSQLEAAWASAGGVMFTGTTWARKTPAFVTPTGSIVMSDRHSLQKCILASFRTPQYHGKANVDPLARGLPITSYQIKNADEMVQLRPIDCTGYAPEALHELEVFAKGHTVGELTPAKWADRGYSSGGSFVPPQGQFILARTFETSLLVSGSDKAKKSGVDLEILTTGEPFAVDNSLGSVMYRCDVFVGYVTSISFNADGSVDVFN